MITLVWFRSDLRLDDNPVLLETLHSDACLPVYCLDPAQFIPGKQGLRGCGVHRATYLLDSLAALHSSLQKRGSGLLVRLGAADQLLPTLCAEFGVNRILTHAEHAPDELALLGRVVAALPEGTLMQQRESNALFAVDDLPFTLNGLPQVFTRFRHQIEKQPPPMQARPAPEYVPPLPSGVDQRLGVDLCLADLGLEPLPLEPRTSIPYQGGEAAAQVWLQDYLWQTQAVRHYKTTRNQLHGHYFSSKLSAALTHGCLSPRRIMVELQRHEQQMGANESTYWLWFELLWREFFRLNLALHGKQFFLRGGLRGDHSRGTHDQRFDDWRSGRTGQPFIDACLRELNATGFLSNRARQIVASYLVYELQQDWRLGAAWFEQQLVDYDVASNWGNWAYIAGVGQDPRGGRHFNIARQVQEHDPGGDYVAMWSDN